MRVLITAGGTEEPVDGVRRLTNTSTGATGIAIAAAFAARGAEVLLLRAERVPQPEINIDHGTFVCFDDLAASLEHHLREQSWDAIIHLAAVADYSVAAVEVDGRKVGSAGKIPSGAQVVIRLRPNAKLIDRLRSWSMNPTIRVVAFKLTNDPNPDAREVRVRALLERGTTDLVVHNDLGEIDGESHPAVMWAPRGPMARTLTKVELAEALFALLDDPNAHHADPRADVVAERS